MHPQGAHELAGAKFSVARESISAKSSTNVLIVVSCAAVAALLFGLDLFTPSGFTPTIGYCVIPLLAAQTGRRWIVVGMSGLCSMLTWLAYFLEPQGAPEWISALNRCMVTGALWFSFLLVWQRMNVLGALARQAEAIAAVNSELTRSNQELDAFAAVASHDIRGPLATTGMLANLVANHLEGKLDRTCSEWLSLIQSEIGRMHSIVENLLEYSRFNSDRSTHVDCDCENILITVLNSLQADLIANGAQVTHDPLPILKGDPTQLAVMFQNLIGNSIKHRSVSPPRVHISVASEQYGWQFSVQDNGMGIDPADADRIFGLFQRGETSQTKKGAGIGLATCKKIAEMHGGRIWVDSSTRGGSTFHFTITNSHPSSTLSSPAKERTREAKGVTP